MSHLFGNDVLVNWPDLASLAARLGLNLVVASIVIGGIYHRLHKNREYVFTYYLFNVITFCLCLLLRKVPTELGMALALFGVFGILRYRTEQIRIRELTYLFIVIGLGVLNALAEGAVSLVELLVVDATVIALAAILERGFASHVERSTPMIYDQLELLRPGNDSKLIADLGARTGLTVLRVEVIRFDLLRDAAEITIFSRDPR